MIIRNLTLHSRYNFIKYNKIKNHKSHLNTKILKKYDLIVIGSGPAATQCAIDSSKRGKHVALVDKYDKIGGVCVHTGTIPSKTFREAVLHFSGFRHQGFYGKSYSVSRKPITIDDILNRVKIVIKNEKESLISRLKGYRIDIIDGYAQFQNTNEIRIIHKKDNNNRYIYNNNINDKIDNNHNNNNNTDKIYYSDKYLIACGTRPAHSPLVPCDGIHIFDSDQLLATNNKRYTRYLPKKLIVVGAGVIGIEYASMINVLPGTQVTVIDSRPELLGFADNEIVSALLYEMRQRGARFLLGETLIAVKKLGNGVSVTLKSGKEVFGDALLYSIGRQANTDMLNLDAVGLEKNERGLLTVNERYQTSIPHIYAAGDCIGPPSLASTSLEQGRLASCDMWDEVKPEVQTKLTYKKSQLSTGEYPYGIYTIPEISMVGKTEKQLMKENTNYQVGIAKYSELARGQMMGGYPGFLKLIFDPETLKILGVHAVGDGATEIIHIGQAGMAMGCNLLYFRDAVFNYPTLAEAYKVAAFNGLGRIYRNKNL